MRIALFFQGALLSVFLVLAPFQYKAIGEELSLSGTEDDGPIEITAEDGIEWWQPKQLYIARGNAKATRNDIDLFGDELTAHYRSDSEGNREIWRIDAIGSVRVVSAKEQAYGDKGVYSVDQGIFVLTGKVRLDTLQESVTATRSLEYWANKNMAVARGNAIAIHEDRRLNGETLVAYFHEPDASGKRKLQRVEAFTDVHVSTPTEIIRGSRGVYNVDSGITTIIGSVKITRGDDQMNGEYAEIDMNTGVSRLLSDPKGGGVRVRVLMAPSKPNKKEK